jgi:serine/threonine-protein phosphatase 2B catalytic subunit
MDTLQDPVGDRQVKTHKAPPHRPLSKQLMFPDKLKSTIVISMTDKPDWKLIRDHLQKEGRVAKPELFKLIQDCNKLLSTTNAIQ